MEKPWPRSKRPTLGGKDSGGIRGGVDTFAADAKGGAEAPQEGNGKGKGSRVLLGRDVAVPSPAVENEIASQLMNPFFSFFWGGFLFVFLFQSVLT